MFKGNVVSILDLTAADADHYGSKAANLGEMYQLGISSPGGMVIHPDANLDSVMPILRRRFVSKYDPDDHRKHIIRSSGLAEDGDNASYAGQHLSILNQYLNTDEELAATRQAIEDCRASGVDATAYREAKGEEAQPIAVIIQRQVAPEQAGVLFTANPVNNDLNTMICEWVNGLADDLVSGKVNPTGAWEWNLGAEKPTVTLGQTDSGTDYMLKQIAGIIVKHFKRPMDIEWVASMGQVQVVQARPLTFGGVVESAMTGQSACKGVATGTGIWLDDDKADEIAAFDDDQILLAYMTTPKMVPAMIKAAGFATAIGGRTCHAAIVARELQKPCVVGVGSLISVPGGANVTVDGDAGQVLINE